MLAGDVKLEGVANTPEHHVAIQRDLNKLEKWAHRSLRKFNKSSAKSCTWGGTIPCTNIC